MSSPHPGVIRRLTGATTREQALSVPAVIFIDNGFACFEQMACTLRRAGVRVAGIAYGGTDRQTRARLHLTYGLVRFARTAKQLRAALAAFVDLDVVDVVCSEGLIEMVLDATVAMGYPDRVIGRLAWRRSWADKRETSHRLASAGVPVPRSVSLPTWQDVHISSVLADIALPAVVKARFGAGGDGVRVVRSRAELEGAVQALRGPDRGLFIEEFIDGRNLCYCASFAAHRVYQEGVYASGRLDQSSTAPSRSVETVDHPSALELGRAVLRAMGGSGLANIEMIDDAISGLHVIDVNPRPWGCIELLRDSGVAFDDGYLAALGLTGPPSTALMPGGFSADVFPVATLDRIAHGRRSALRHYASTVPTQIRTVGPRYAAAAAADMGLRLVRPKAPLFARRA